MHSTRYRVPVRESCLAFITVSGIHSSSSLCISSSDLKRSTKMKTPILILLISLSFTFISSAMELVEAKRNQISKKLIGEWQINEKLTRQLAPGEADEFEKMLAEISFTTDETALASIPDKVKEKVGSFIKKYYAIGWCTAGRLKVPYILISEEGTVQLIVFTDRGDKKYSDPDSLYVSMAFSNDAKSDILFVVNERSGASIAYKRKK